MKTRLFVFILLILFPFFNLSGQNRLLENAEELFMNNKPAEAVPLLLSALEQSPENGKIYMMLGIASSQTGNYQKAVDYFREGAKKSLNDKDIYYYNAGNIYYLMGKYQLAEDMYTKALLENGEKGGIYLNRANARLMMNMKEPAVSDYRTFLAMEPENYQKESIQRLISLLEKETQQEIIAKQEEERRRIAEEQRRQDLLKDVLDSLKDVKEETRKVSAGTESISDYDEELELDE